MIGYILAELILFRYIFLSNSVESPTNIANFTFSFPVITPLTITGIYPSTGNSLIWLYGNATFTTADGSSNTNDILNVTPRTPESAYVLRLSSEFDRIMLKAQTSSGFLYLSGTGTVSWNQTLPTELSQGPQIISRQLQLGPEFVAIDLSTAGSIVFSTDSSALIRMWSDQYAEPTYGRYVMQPFLEGHSGFSISIGDINNTFTIAVGSAAAVTATIPNGLFLNPESFITSLQAAIDGALGPSSGLTVDLESFDSENADMLHVSNLRWSSASATYTIALPSTNPKKSATAATLGLYTFDGLTDAAVVPTLTVETPSVLSPSPVFVQWPVTWTLRAYTNPGSADTDGIVKFYPDDATTVPSLVLGASDSTYEIYGPNTKIGPISTYVRNDAGFTVPASVYFELTSTTSTSQTVTSFTIVPEQNALWTTFLSASETSVPTLKLNNLLESSLGGSPKTLIEHFGNDGITCTLSSLSQSVTADIFDDITTLISFGSFSVGSVLSFKGTGRKVKRYTLADDANSYSFLDSTIVEGWAGGGGSILNASPITYGGATTHVKMKLIGSISSMVVDVGTRGTILTANSATGGRSTKVTINGNTLFHIGGGGGAASGSNGGQGGGPVGTNDIPADAIIKWAGFSASINTFSPAPTDNQQVRGPTAKPEHIIINDGSLETENYQGSGCGPLGQPGLDGFFLTSTNEDIPQLKSGGTGGYGYSGTLSPSASSAQGGTGLKLSSTTSAAIFGGGGGGSTAVRNLGTYTNEIGTIEVSELYINGPFLVNYDTQPRPLGGGEGPYLGVVSNYYAQVKNFCDNFSLMSILVEDIWPFGQQTQFVTGLLGLLIKYIAEDAALIVPSTINNVFWPVHDSFVNGPIANDAAVESYVPIGPHDKFMPNQNGPNVRPITAPDNALSDDSLTLSIFNDGQINMDESNFLLNTPFTGPDVPYNTYVIGIRFGQSEPSGLHSAIFLTLSNPLVNTNGPFAWNFSQELSVVPIFQNGTPFHSSKLLVPWDTTVQLSDVAPDAAAELTSDLYSVMGHVFVQSAQVTVPGDYYFPNLWTLPPDSASGPSYLSNVWPSTVFSPDGPVSTLSLRVFTKPMGAPPQIANRKWYKKYFSSTVIQELNVPASVKSVSFYVFGAGGSSTDSAPGGNGSFAFGTFTNLAGKTVEIFVGNPGGFPPRAIALFNGGLNGSLTGGGGLSGIRVAGKWIIVAGGGGQSTKNKALHELSLESGSIHHGKAGAVLTNLGENALNGGAGGSGFYGGSRGQRGQPGGAGSSLVPTGGFISQNIEKQKYWIPGFVGLGSTSMAGTGLVAVELFY